MKNRKTKENIQKEILRFLINSKYKTNACQSIAEGISSNWITVKDYIEELEEEGVIKIIRVENKSIVGIELNWIYIILLHEVFLEQTSGNNKEGEELLNKLLGGLI